MFTLNCKGRLLLIDEPIVMGIINITPDSFFRQSRKIQENVIIDLAGKMLADGATIIDLGGQSTRPGSEKVSDSEEVNRVIPAIEAIRSAHPAAFISVDTYYASVAREAIKAGGDIINDIGGGQIDKEMIAAVGAMHVPYICMHMKGTPQTMQENTTYHNLLTEVLDFFISKTEECRLAGIHDVIIDPGFGFSKTIPQNFELLRKMEALKILGKPVLAGLSRKGTIYKTLGVTADEALNGTTALNTIALLNGANILRVHDVKEAVETITLYKIITDKTPKLNC